MNSHEMPDRAVFAQCQLSKLEFRDLGRSVFLQMIENGGRRYYEVFLHDVLHLAVKKFPDSDYDCVLIEAGSLERLEDSEAIKTRLQKFEFRFSLAREIKSIVALDLSGEFAISCSSLSCQVLRFDS